MDSNSGSPEMCIKLECESDGEKESRRDPKMLWGSNNTMKLITLLENECKELWDIKHPAHKDKKIRQARYEFLAEVFGTNSEEICRKIHNLRTQFNNELRKIKKKQVILGDATSSSWEYFDALGFLMRDDAFLSFENGCEGVNLALAEFQAEEDETFGAAVRAQLATAGPSTSVVPVIKERRPQRVAASAPPPLPPSAHPMMWPEEALPRLRPGHHSTDECQIFGDFVASELRTLRSDESRKKLKRAIQKAILQIEEEEDINMFNRH